MADSKYCEVNMNAKEVMELFEKKRNKVEILWEALDYMKQYNGRSRVECIALAMNVDLE